MYNFIFSFIYFFYLIILIFLVAANTIVDKPIDSEAQNTVETNTPNEGTEQPTDTFDSFFKDFEAEENENNKCNPSIAESSVQHTVQPSVQSQNTKQSLFIRLANRIKVIYLILKIVKLAILKYYDLIGHCFIGFRTQYVSEW